MNQCSNCQKETKNKKYCSRSCSATVNNKGILRNQPGGTRKARGDVKCLYCSSDILSKNIGKYCSVTCHRRFENSILLNKWLTGEWDGSSSQGASKIVKDYLLKLCNNECSKCGWKEINPVTNKVPLELNHIDGNSTNNVISNLEIVCPNCHSLTPNFRALNKNSKRGYRRK